MGPGPNTTFQTIWTTSFLTLSTPKKMKRALSLLCWVLLEYKLKQEQPLSGG